MCQINIPVNVMSLFVELESTVESVKFVANETEVK